MHLHNKIIDGAYLLINILIRLSGLASISLNLTGSYQIILDPLNLELFATLDARSYPLIQFWLHLKCKLRKYVRKINKTSF